MSSFSILHDVSQDLRQQIFTALDSAPDVDFSLTSAAANIALSPPDDLSDHVCSVEQPIRSDLSKPVNNETILRVSTFQA